MEQVRMMKTRTGRTIALNLVVGALFDIAIAAAVAQLFDGDYWTVFLLALAALWLLPILFRLRNTLLRGLLFLVHRKATRRLLVQEFRKAKLPLLSDTSFNDPADLYFSEVAGNDDHPKDARLFSAKPLVSWLSCQITPGPIP
jgi:hypothetical protein